MEAILIQFSEEDKAQKFIKDFDIKKYGASSISSHKEEELAKLYIDIAILRGDVSKITSEDLPNKIALQKAMQNLDYARDCLSMVLKSINNQGVRSK